VTTYSLFTGSGPGTGTAYATGDLVEGVNFGVTTGSLWLYGYRQWILPSVQAVTGYKYALYQITGVDASSPATGGIPGTIVTAGTLTAGQWNVSLLPAPLLLAPSATPGTGPTYGAAYHACVGQPAAAWGAFPETKNIFGTGDPSSGGISNGPLYGFSSVSGTTPVGGTANQWLPQMAFTTSIADPTSGMPTQNDTDANLWIDVLVSTVPPAGASYQMLPTMPAFNVPGVGAQQSAYTLGTAFTLTAPATLKAIWHYSPPGSTVLPSRCGIWNANTQVEVAGTDNSSPAWSGAAASGWVSCTYAAGPTLPAGNYVVSTFTAAGTSPWFLAQTLWWSSAFPSGITQGPISFTGTQYNHSPTWTFPATTAPEYDGVDVQFAPAGSGPSLPSYLVIPAGYDFLPAAGQWPLPGAAAGGTLGWFPV
jgi:hypothetical protein